MTPEPGSAAVTADVLFLRLRPSAEATLPQQGRWREELAARMRAALASWQPGAHVVLEAPDGLAVVARAAPAAALQGARRALAWRGEHPVGIGLHRGSVRAGAQDGGAAIVAGEALETAAALAGAGAGTGTIVASQAFRAALAAESARSADALRPLQGELDASLQPHAPHLFDAAAERRQALRRKVLGLSGLALLLAAGWGTRLARERYEAARRPAVILLDVRPSGEVFVDGEPKGTSPPLVRLSLPPGPHTIELRNGRFKPLRMDVQLQPGEEMQLRHVFAAPPARRPPKPQRQEPGVLERFRFW